MFSLLRVKQNALTCSKRVNNGRAVRLGRRPNLPTDLHRTASRARRERWWQERRGQRRHSRTKETSEGRKKEKRASEDGSNNNDRRKKKTKKKEKEDLDHADWIGLDCWLLPFSGQLPLRFSTHDSNIYYASSF